MKKLNYKIIKHHSNDEVIKMVVTINGNIHSSGWTPNTKEGKAWARNQIKKHWEIQKYIKEKEEAHYQAIKIKNNW